MSWMNNGKIAYHCEDCNVENCPDDAPDVVPEEGIQTICPYFKLKRPSIIEIDVKVFDEVGIEKEFHFHSMNELKEWWKNPYGL